MPAWLMAARAWVSAIAAFVRIERAAPFGSWIRRTAGALLVALGVATLGGLVA